MKGNGYLPSVITIGGYLGKMKNMKINLQFSEMSLGWGCLYQYLPQLFCSLFSNKEIAGDFSQIVFF